jgi:diguanylate cyclase (GGDEF)-like protein
MNETPAPKGTAAGAEPVGGAADAERDLARVNDKIEAARAVLLRLLQDVVVAESRLSNSQAAQILEANEQLVVAALRNQAETKTATQALADVTRSAEIDPLTQLPNRVLLMDRFAQAIAAAKRRSARLALLFLDLNDFKQINDAQGHAVGDEVLVQVARRLSSAVREADTVSRHGGDEFLILLTEMSQPADAGLLASKLLAALSAPFQVGDQLLQLTGSIGLSIYPDDGEDAKTLIDRADAAMYRAKQKGAGSFALHGEVAAPTPSPAPPAPFTAYELALARHQRRNTDLQEANERLLLAALSAQELQAAAERARQRQAEFMAAVAEELANPFAPIRLATAMLGRAKTDEPLLPRVRTLIEQQVEHMSRLVGAASDRSREPEAALALAGQVSDLVVLIDDAVRDIRAVMDLRLQSLTVAVPAGPVDVCGDAESLAQVLGNLLDNASKFTLDRGAIRLDAVLDGANVVLTVADDGIGIAPEVVPRIFEPFGQDSRAIGLNGVGVGIGLPVVRVLVKELGGTVVAESAGNGRGSRFVVTLPLAATAPAAPGAPDSTAVTVGSVPHGSR